MRGPESMLKETDELSFIQKLPFLKSTNQKVDALSGEVNWIQNTLSDGSESRLQVLKELH